jgi:hypothetical protein
MIMVIITITTITITTIIIITTTIIITMTTIIITTTITTAIITTINLPQLTHQLMPWHESSVILHIEVYLTYPTPAFSG